MAKGSSIAGGALSGAGTGAAIGTAFGPGIGTAIGAGVGALAGGVLPALMGDGSDESEQEKEARLKALELISNIQSPELQQLALEQYQSQGELDPEFEKEIKLQDTEMKKISLDPRFKQAQMEALQNFRDLGRTGLRAEDRLALEEINLKAARDAQAQREAVLQNRQMRGLAGGGDELVTQLQGGQSEANSARLAGLQRAAMAQQAALQSIAQAGSLGGQIRQQEYGEQSDLAKAADEINRFNTSAQIARQERNVNRSNTAQATNLQNKQNLANLNVGLKNQANVYNTQTLPQQQFENQFGVAKAQSNALTGQAQSLGSEAAAKQQALQNVLQGAGQAALAGGQAVKEYKAGQNEADKLAMQKAQLSDEQLQRYEEQKKKAGLV